ncbi:MAG TPA: dihydroorotate dehydrogenase electron transfer subunit [Bacteroidales bacterium]|nr:dihydroorotate dehydrogenase electron transfer subunit [Bacteroidales bacterium]HPS71370.1 dihydroorotate dehydrogenase electron transfer subunit [Bacteroidales bacterium]
MEYTKLKVINNKKIGSDIYVLKVAKYNEIISPGQFFMIKCWDDHLPLFRPISVYNVESDAVYFMYRTIGKGTEKMAHLKKGSEVELLGPLGNGFPVEKVKGKIALVGGGVGIPPLYETAKRLLALGNTVDIYLGYRDELFGFEEFLNVSHNLFVSSEHGNEGYKGYITDIFHAEQYDAVFTCGPEVMMFKVRDLCKEANVPSWLSMEKHMACGVGACLVCNCDTIHGTVRTCKDGPVFFGNDIL